MRSGGWIPLLVLLPNLLWMLLPPGGQPQARTASISRFRRVMDALEWVGRIATLVLPFFYSVQVHNTRQAVAVAVMAVALSFYYAAWARYFSRGRSSGLLFESLLGVPVPLAVCPIVCFLAASVLFGSWCLALATVIFGVAHLWISLLDRKSR
ncbi:MAG: hypothetical protein FJ026_06220 [Chloroflexi bacterium]|nr:hypothetical protein [Chloroflexota bacterium]